MKLILPFLLYLIANSAFAEKHDIEIIKFIFTPAEITIQTGDTIRWTNKEKRQYHSVWFEELGEPEPDYFFPDEFYERTFDKEGEFPYRCGPHPKMRGVVHVTGSPKSQTEAKPVKSTNEPSSDLIKETTKETKTDKISAIEPGQLSQTVLSKTKQNTANEITADRKKEILHILKHDCGSCHGMTLKGGLGPALIPEALKLTEEQIAFTISNGRPGTPMPPWKPFFNQPETLWLAQQLKQGLAEGIVEINTQNMKNNTETSPKQESNK